MLIGYARVSTRISILNYGEALVQELDARRSSRTKLQRPHLQHHRRPRPVAQTSPARSTA